MNQGHTDTFLNAVLSIGQDIIHIVKYTGTIHGALVDDFKIG